jgi:hypothetical protein
MPRSINGFIDLQSLLEIMIGVFCVSLSLKSSPQAVQGYGYMGMQLAVIGLLSLQILLIVRPGQGQVVADLIIRPEADGIPGWRRIDSAGLMLYFRRGRFLLNKVDPSFVSHHI